MGEKNVHFGWIERVLEGLELIEIFNGCWKEVPARLGHKPVRCPTYLRASCMELSYIIGGQGGVAQSLSGP